jgi:hypothetical protein
LSAPAPVGRHAGAGLTVLVVPGLGADAEAAHHAETAMGRSLLPPEVFEPVRRPDRVLNVAVTEVRLQGARVMAGIGQGEAARVSQHVRARLEGEAGRLAGTLDLLAKPAVANGAPRSLVKTNGDGGLSRCSLRRARISSPRNGCVAGVPFFTRRT